VQANGYYWFRADREGLGAAATCTEVCSNHDGIAPGNWNDDTSCSVNSQFGTCTACGQWGGDAPFGNNNGYCYYRSAQTISPDPDANYQNQNHDPYYNLCACNQ